MVDRLDRCTSWEECRRDLIAMLSEAALTAESEATDNMVCCWSLLLKPAGSDNFLDDEGDGAQTTAYEAGSDFWTLNGDKIWGTSCSGWDDLGADLQVLFIRSLAITTSKIDSSMLILLARQVLDQNRTSGNQTCYSSTQRSPPPTSPYAPCLSASSHSLGIRPQLRTNQHR
jgi:hypothetical protein